ncbi:MAG: hypothetical protein ACRCSV_05205 [Chlamydiales bacterium]
MNLGIVPAHRTFFVKNDFIVFDNMLTTAEISALQTLLGEVPRQDATNLFLRYPSFKRYILNKKFAEIAFFLLNINPIRIASDQFIRSSSDPLIAAKLEEKGTLQPLVCGLLLNINQTPLESSESTDNPLSCLPTQPGSGVFFQPHFTFPYDQLSNYPGQYFILITYGSKRLIYTKNESDPDLYFLKKKGYNFNLPISIATHPILIDLPQPYLFK